MVHIWNRDSSAAEVGLATFAGPIIGGVGLYYSIKSLVDIDKRIGKCDKSFVTSLKNLSEEREKAK